MSSNEGRKTSTIEPFPESTSASTSRKKGTANNILKKEAVDIHQNTQQQKTQLKESPKQPNLFQSFMEGFAKGLLGNTQEEDEKKKTQTGYTGLPTIPTIKPPKQSFEKMKEVFILECLDPESRKLEEEAERIMEQESFHSDDPRIPDPDTFYAHHIGPDYKQVLNPILMMSNQTLFSKFSVFLVKFGGVKNWLRLRNQFLLVSSKWRLQEIQDRKWKQKTQPQKKEQTVLRPRLVTNYGQTYGSNSQGVYGYYKPIGTQMRFTQ